MSSLRSRRVLLALLPAMGAALVVLGCWAGSRGAAPAPPALARPVAAHPGLAGTGRYSRRASELGASARSVRRAASPPPGPPPPETSHSLESMPFAGRTRQYLEVTALKPVSPSIPILLVLHGRGVPPQAELERDGFLPLASQGRADLVYPAGLGASWNAGGCCGLASRERVDDVGFIESLVPSVDPGGIHPLFLVGFSNGGRLTHTIACADPALAAGFAVVDAVPVQDCAAPRPIRIIQVDGTEDQLVPYRPGDGGIEHPPATIEAERLRALDGCTAPPVTTRAGALLLRASTGCRGGADVAFATYEGAAHEWPAGDTSTPSAASVIWTFLTAGASW